MSYVGVLSSVELGFLFGLVALGVYLTFRVLDFPDLTVDGSFATGAAVTAAMLSGNGNPWVATAVAVVVGALCGLVTAVLNRRFGMLHLLAGILTTIALFSIDLRIMGRPNIPLLSEATVLTPFETSGVGEAELRTIVAAFVALAATLLLGRFLTSEYGLALRATGTNPRMARANGIDLDRNVYVGLAISNGIAALAGALFAQFAGFADVSVGGGTILFGLAAVILGEALVPTRRIYLVLLSCILGSILYRLAVGFALNSQFLGLQSSDLRLVTALLVALAFIVSSRRGTWQFPFARKAALSRSKAQP